VRVNSDKQTLILAGEPIPWRLAVEPHLTIVATRADDTMLLAQGDLGQQRAGGHAPSASMTRAAATDSHNKLSRSGYPSSYRGAYFSAASEYARTQDFSGHGRTAIIDTYA
jgi:hypothetical protein